MAGVIATGIENSYFLECLECFLKKTQEIAFVKGNGAVVEEPLHGICHLRKLRELLFFYAQRSKAFWDSNFCGELLDQSSGLGGSVGIGFGFEARIQTARDECHFLNARRSDTSHHRGQQHGIS